MTHSNAFVQFMADTYEAEELQNIASHGCESGCAGGMIYYSETTELFNKYKDELFEIMDNYQAETGLYECGDLPDYVRKHAGTFTQFANAVVWFCAEVVAYELSNQGE